MGKGNVTIDGKTYEEKTAMELLPSDARRHKGKREFAVLHVDAADVLTSG